MIIERDIALALTDAGYMPLPHYLKLCQQNNWPTDHPPAAIAADDRGPGAPDAKCADCPPAHFDRPPGAPAPHPEIQALIIADHLLNNSGAC